MSVSAQAEWSGDKVRDGLRQAEMDNGCSEEGCTEV